MPDTSFFDKLLPDFLAYCHSESLTLGELEQPKVFFEAPPVQRLLNFGAENPSVQMEIVAALAQIEQMPPLRGSLAGYLIGLYGENGMSSKQTDLALAKFYLNALDLCSEYLWLACQYLGIEPSELIANADVAEERRQELIKRIQALPPDVAAFHQPEAMQAWRALSPLSFGMMSRLAASRELRDFFRQHNEEGRLFGMCSLLAEWHDAIGFIPYMLDLQEEGLALVISPAARRGVEVYVSQIDSNNLFFTLLQMELYHHNLLEALGGLPFNYNPLIEKIAKHEPLSESEWPEHIQEQGYLGYYAWPALRADGSFDDRQPVWGEGIFADIPKLGGQTIVLVGAPQISRSWGNAFVAGCHKNLRPQVQIRRELEPDEVRQWLAEIRRANQN